MSFLHNLSAATLRAAANIKDKIVELEKQYADAMSSTAPVTTVSPVPPFKPKGKGKRVMSASAKKKIAAAQKARWAKFHAAIGGKASKAAKVVKTSVKAAKAVKKRKGMSAAGKAKIAAAQKARWAKVNAAKSVEAAK
jgi:hypothetical protein